jgi:hypothetical protein
VHTPRNRGKQGKAAARHFINPRDPLRPGAKISWSCGTIGTPVDATRSVRGEADGAGPVEQWHKQKSDVRE